MSRTMADMPNFLKIVFGALYLSEDRLKSMTDEQIEELKLKLQQKFYDIHCNASFPMEVGERATFERAYQSGLHFELSEDLSEYIRRYIAELKK